MSAPRFVVIGNPENRRVQMFQEALAALRLPPADVISYAELLRAPAAGLPQAAGNTVYRLDSPGENAQVERALIERGIRAEQRAGRLPQGARLPDSIHHGQIVAPNLWYAGFRDLLQQLDGDNRHLRWMTPPADVLQMFAKPDCQALLERKEIPVPRRLGPVDGYDHLRALMTANDTRRVFIKLNHGSSASGVIAFRLSSRHCEATTSVEMVSERGELLLFNSLQLRRYRSEAEVAALIDTLAPLGLFAEQWVPKAGFAGRTFDLRILLIGGEVRQMVMRTSRSPLTNLHLGNQRGDVGELLQQLPPATRQAAWESCRRVADVFPGSTSIGIDLGFTPGWKTHVIFEVNAFGDLLPGVTHRGQSTYEAAIDYCVQRQFASRAMPVAGSPSIT